MAKMFQVYGIGQALIPVLPPPLPFENAPTSNQVNYEIGQVVYTPPRSPTAFYLYGGAGNWINFTGSSGNITSISGTANQVSVATSSGAATISLPSAITVPGSLSTTTALTAGTTLSVTGLSTLAALTQSGAVNINTGAVSATTNIGTGAAIQSVNIGSSNTTSNVQLVGGTTSLNLSTSAGASLVGGLGVSGLLTFGVVGGGLNYANGTGSRAGTVTLVSGTVTVANANITSNSKITTSRIAANASTALGDFSYTLNPGTGFTINSLNPASPGSVLTTDVSTVYYVVNESF